MAHWGYTGETGPDNWGKHFEHAKGTRQSPIDIVCKDVKVDASLNPPTIDYSSAKCVNVVNNGHTFQINVESTDTNLSGGPLSHKYRLVQFHCHWGSKDGCGSEHTVDGKSHDAELHLVHWNTDMFSDVGDAITQDKGVAVLTAFMKIGKDNPQWSKLVALLNNVKCKDDKCNIEDAFDPSILLPENKRDYWTYEGSLTTPPCYESVRFIIYKEPVEVSPEQMNALRGLQDHCVGEKPCPGTSGCLSDNYRPTMPLNDRVVTASFQQE